MGYTCYLFINSHYLNAITVIIKKRLPVSYKKYRLKYNYLIINQLKYNIVAILLPGLNFNFGGL